jgi:hypothetical protein
VCGVSSGFYTTIWSYFFIVLSSEILPALQIEFWKKKWKLFYTSHIGSNMAIFICMDILISNKVISIGKLRIYATKFHTNLFKICVVCHPVFIQQFDLTSSSSSHLTCIAENSTLKTEENSKPVVQECWTRKKVTPTEQNCREGKLYTHRSR